MASSSSTVQHLTKASSDELLRKFAETDSDVSPTPRSANKLIGGPIRRKKSRRVVSGLAARDVTATATNGDSSPARKRRRSGSVAEWNSLLPTSGRRLPMRNAGVGFLLAAFEKAWIKTIKGASKMMVEKQRINRHVRLISDVA